MDEMFFSTTDRLGIIRAGNSVFARISGYPIPELVGAPHNIVRHPDMPGGAFKLIWERLLAGRPAAAYVQNLAKDGRSYWVFATMMPVGGGFPSVRICPMTNLYLAARRLYQTVRVGERRARSRGLSRAEAAACGASELEQGIRALEFDSYEDFMTQALPAEVAARADLVAARFARETAQGPAGDILAATAGLDHHLDALVDRLDRYHDLSQALADSSWSTLEAASQLGQAAAAARDGSALIAGHAPVLDNVAQVMVEPCHDAVGMMQSVVSQLAALRGSIASLRFRIALARLHNDMVAAFAAEVIHGTAPQSSLGEVPLLCQALHEGVTDMATAMAAVNGTLASVAKAVDVAGELFGKFRAFAGEWRRLVLRHRAGGDLADHVGPIDRMLRDSHAQLSGLRVLAQRCHDEIFPFDDTPLDTELDTIRAALRRL
jgi:PAS domain S-box-containing protein